MQGLALFTAVLAVAALFAPFWAGEPERVAGLFLLAGAAAELRSGIPAKDGRDPAQRLDERRVHAASGLLLLNASWLVSNALAMFVAAPFAVDGLRYGVLMVRQIAEGKSARQAATAAAWNLGRRARGPACRSIRHPLDERRLRQACGWPRPRSIWRQRRSTRNTKRI